MKKNEPPKSFEHFYGKTGTCTICHSKSHTIVNEVCLECSKPQERKEDK